ncbi:Acetyltransferase-like protein [Sulfitobacter noctilucicola]|nr:Acetyltransferase-like protein [Sulfitobacter noctilucicola]
MHAAAFVHERPWSSDEFASLLNSDHVSLLTDEHSFALARTVAGESELLTLAVDPDHQRCGLGRKLTRAWLTAARAQADVAFLEVAADNAGAHALYTAEGFAEVGRRKGYYMRKNAAPADAIVMRRDLTLGHHGVLHPPT